MATPAHDKYFLRSLHQDIDLFDRKLAHMLKYDTFTTDAERNASAGKLTAKRELLARTARQLVSEGIEFKESDLPRSFREPDAVPTVHSESAPAAEAAPIPVKRSPAKPLPSPFAGTALDGATGLENYKRGRSRAAVAKS